VNLKCIIGIHYWKGCSCTKCKTVRKKGHDFSKDCEKCSICGESARKIITSCPDCGEEYSNWVAYPYCQKCKKYIFHDGSSNCEICSKCGMTLNKNHNWNKNCEKCSVCGTTRENQHHWDGCKCIQCGIVRDEKHDWSANCEHCSKCKAIRNNYHTMVYKNHCSYVCSVCGFVKSVHFFNKCHCKDYAFVNYLTENVIEDRYLGAIKATLESLKVLKNNNETDYFQFNINEVQNIYLLKNILHLHYSESIIYAIDFSIKNKKANYYTENHENLNTLNNSKLYLTIKRISKETYIIVKK